MSSGGMVGARHVWALSASYCVYDIWHLTWAGRVDGQKKEAAQPLWGMLYADDAGIVSRSPEGLEKMMTVIGAAFAAFGLTVLEAKTEIMCLQTKGGGHVPFTVTATGQVFK